MAEALKRYDEATDTWITVSSVNRIEVIESGLVPYVYPSDWIDIRNAPLGSIQFLVGDTQLNVYTFHCHCTSGTYQVDWGDGTVLSYTSGTDAQHIYVPNSGVECTRGYTTYKITISANNDITVCTVARHELYAYSYSKDNPFILACSVNVPTLVGASSMFSDSITCDKLEYFECIGSCAIDDTSHMFKNCANLQYIDLSGFNYVFTSIYMFENCKQIKSVDMNWFNGLYTAQGMFSGSGIEQLDLKPLVSLTNSSEMFSNCFNLKSVDMSGLENISQAYSMFLNCKSLTEVKFKWLYNLSNTASMFQGCETLSYIDPSHTADLIAVTNAPNMFSYCRSLLYIDVSTLSLVRTSYGMFSYCDALKYADVSGMKSVEDAMAMFYGCYSLETVVATDFAKDIAYSIRFTNAFWYCYNLKSINFPNTRISTISAQGTSSFKNKLETLTFHPLSTFDYGTTTVDISYCTLTATQLNVIFTALPSVYGKKINITGCNGASTCNRSIATAKGWTVTG